MLMTGVEIVLPHTNHLVVVKLWVMEGHVSLGPNGSFQQY
jgi:hypothetical protein